MRGLVAVAAVVTMAMAGLANAIVVAPGSTPQITALGQVIDGGRGGFAGRSTFFDASSSRSAPTS